jgi:hypothetical protein
MAKRKIIKNSHYEKIGIASRKRNRSEVMLPNDVLTCTIVPIMTVPVSQCQHSFPDLKLVSKLHEICSSGISNQKAIAMKCKISATKMSQFMNGASRKKGWTNTEIIIRAWLDQFESNSANNTPRPFDSDNQPNLAIRTFRDKALSSTPEPEIDDTTYDMQSVLLNPESYTLSYEGEWMQFTINQIFTSNQHTWQQWN